jgi:hypothetical protein
LPEFSASGEPYRLFQAIKLEYKDVDDIQRRYTIKTLDDVVREGQQLPEERLREYLDTFNDVSSELEKKGILSAYDRGMKFMMGLPPFLRIRVGERLHFNPLDPETVRYKDCYTKAVEMVRDRRNLRELDSYSQEGTSSRPYPGHRSVLRPPQQSEPHKPEPIPVQQNDDDLIRKFMGLNISMNEVRSRMHDADRIQQENEELRMRLNERHPAQRGVLNVNALGSRYSGPPRGNINPDERKCFMCWNETGSNGERFPHHTHVTDCPLYGRLFADGICWYDSDNEDRSKRGLYWGVPMGKGMRIRCNSQEPFWKQVVAKGRGTEYDVDPMAREEYRRRLESNRPKLNPESYGRDIPKGRGNVHASVSAVEVMNEDFEDLGRLTYEELAATVDEEDRYVVDSLAIEATAIESNAVLTRSKARKEAESAQELIRDRQRREAKYARPKHAKPALLVENNDDVEMDVRSGENRDQIRKAAQYQYFSDTDS